MNRYFTTTLLALAFSLSLSAQYLISSEFLGQETKADLEARFGLDLRNGIKKYKVTYMTTGTNGEPDTASGLIVVPTTRLEGKLALVAYQHGTTSGPDDVPSLEGSGLDEARAYGGSGYFVCAADYLGLGDNDSFHPYVHAGTEASAGRDLMFAASEFIEDEFGDIVFDFTFISGYSQGGHAAMALMQEIEENWSIIYPLTAATPMSGPYSISDVMFDRMVGDQAYLFVSYPIYAILGYQEVYGNIYDSLEQVFKPAYVSAIESFYNREVNLVELTTFVLTNLIVSNGAPIPKYMFRDAWLADIIADEDHPLRVAMRENDTYNWTTQTPTRLLYCTADDQVPFRNTIVADSILNENGSPDVELMDMDPDADHGECALPAIVESIRFFDSFIITSSSEDIAVTETQIAFPNPADDKLNINFGMHGENYRYSMISASGRTAMEFNGSSVTTVDVSAMAPGLYILRAENDNHAAIQKIIIR